MPRVPRTTVQLRNGLRRIRGGRNGGGTRDQLMAALINSHWNDLNVRYTRAWGSRRLAELRIAEAEERYRRASATLEETRENAQETVDLYVNLFERRPNLERMFSSGDNEHAELRELRRTSILAHEHVRAEEREIEILFDSMEENNNVDDERAPSPVLSRRRRRIAAQPIIPLQQQNRVEESRVALSHVDVARQALQTFQARIESTAMLDDRTEEEVNAEQLNLQRIQDTASYLQACLATPSPVSFPPPSFNDDGTPLTPDERRLLFLEKCRGNLVKHMTGDTVREYECTICTETVKKFTVMFFCQRVDILQHRICPDCSLQLALRKRRPTCPFCRADTTICDEWSTHLYDFPSEEQDDEMNNSLDDDEGEH